MISSTRSLSIADARELQPGDDHYRAYVGPPDRYDLIATLQLSVLFFLGLRDTDEVLDFGCGSLRLGRLLIPYLQPEGYFGIEPNAWLVDEGARRELGADALALKRPRFDQNDRFDCTVFGQRFDFIMAQSILTHTGFAPAQALCRSFAQALKPGGLAVVNWIVGEADDPAVHETDWLYPHCHTYGPDTVAHVYEQAGLAARVTRWWHPGGARWDVLALDEASLPAQSEFDRIDFKPLHRLR